MTVLVIDIGSSSVRTMLFDEAARPIENAIASRTYTFNTTPPGASIVDALWLRQQVEDCIDMILQHPAAAKITVAGMACFVGNMLGIDHEQQPITPVFTYADSRSAAAVDALSSKIDHEAFYQRTGCPHHTAYQPGRLHWLRYTQPEAFSQVSHWVDFATYLYSGWFGASPISYSTASWSGMFNRESLSWDSIWLDVLEMSAAQFPETADYTDFCQGLLPDYQRRWPLLKNVPFCLSLGDGAAANVGVGAVDSDTLALTVGTTAALRMISDENLPAVPGGLWSYRLDARHHLIGGATTEGGSIYQWARSVLSLDGIDLEAELLRREPDSHHLTFLPLLAGERSPGWAVNAQGSIAGLRLSTTPLDILQAALESVALRLSIIADKLIHRRVKVLAGGGALKSSAAWAQIIANALNQPLYLAAESETTARGVAILALRAVGEGDLTSFPAEIERLIEPDEHRAEMLRKARDRQMDLYAMFYSSR